MNCVCTSRQLTYCAAEPRWAGQRVLEDGLVYLPDRTTATSVPGLAGPATSMSCFDVGWTLVCSLQSLQAAAQATPLRSWERR